MWEKNYFIIPETGGLKDCKELGQYTWVRSGFGLSANEDEKTVRNMFAASL